MCTGMDIENLAAMARAGAGSQVQQIPDLSGQARADRGVGGSFFGQQGQAQNDVQGIVDLMRAIEQKRYSGGVLTPIRRTK